jgi:hypothetical protein
LEHLPNSGFALKNRAGPCDGFRDKTGAADVAAITPRLIRHPGPALATSKSKGLKLPRGGPEQNINQ